jgi:nucleolar protein 53
VEAEQRQLSKAQRRAIATLPALVSGLSASEQASAASRKLKHDLMKRRLAQTGLTKLRSGKHLVPATFPDYQLEDELPEGLRTLKSEGSLWKDYKHSMMKRGKLEPRAERRRESKQKGRKTRTVERYDFKRFK